MNKKLKIILCSCLILITLSIIQIYFNFTQPVLISEKKEFNKNTFAVMIEQDNDEYISYEGSGLPDLEMYGFNSNKSYCVYGSIVSFDETNNSFKLSTNGRDNCFLYFEKKETVAIYSADDSSLRFYNTSSEITVGEKYNDLTVTNLYTDFIDEEYDLVESFAPWSDLFGMYDPDLIVIEDKISPKSIKGWFTNISEGLDYIKVDKIDISKITDLSHVFSYSGGEVSWLEFTIEGLENWDVSHVTNMSHLFSGVAGASCDINIGDITGWNVSNVTDMSYMFYSVSIYDNDGSAIFGDLSDWDVSNVTNMSNMFVGVNFKFGDISGWDTSSVEDMSNMFWGSDYSKLKDTFVDIADWDVSNVKNMSNMFYDISADGQDFDLSALSKWNTTKVTNMSEMFRKAGYEASTFTLNLSTWKTSNVGDMSGMFKDAGYNATSFTLGDITSWDTINVWDMSEMFYNAGYSATYSLNLYGNWSVPTVTSYSNFNTGVESKVTPPAWVT